MIPKVCKRLAEVDFPLAVTKQRRWWLSACLPLTCLPFKESLKGLLKPCLRTRRQVTELQFYRTFWT